MLTPLPAGSSWLRDGRYQVEIASPIGPGRFRVHATARFPLTSNLPSIIAWAENRTPKGDRFTITLYRARDGWTPHHVPVK